MKSTANNMRCPMKNRRSTLFSVFLLLLFIPQVVSANSSWCWISETRPYDVLPVVAIATILVECGMINRCIRPKNYHVILAYVSVANLLSFICPYIINYCRLTVARGYQPISEMFEHWPAYTVGICFLIMTIAVELPIVYFGLKKRSDNKKKIKRNYCFGQRDNNDYGSRSGAIILSGPLVDNLFCTLRRCFIDTRSDIRC